LSSRRKRRAAWEELYSEGRWEEEEEEEEEKEEMQRQQRKVG
jgi:hypothetical protein